MREWLSLLLPKVPSFLVAGLGGIALGFIALTWHNGKVADTYQRGRDDMAKEVELDRAATKDRREAAGHAAAASGAKRGAHIDNVTGAEHDRLGKIPVADPDGVCFDFGLVREIEASRSRIRQSATAGRGDGGVSAGAGPAAASDEGSP